MARPIDELFSALEKNHAPLTGALDELSDLLQKDT